MQHRFKQTAAVFLVSIALAGTASAANPSYDHYKSWLVACDNGLTCEAKGFANGKISSPDLRFIRAAGPDATTEAKVHVPFPVSLSDFRADGKSLHLGPSWTLSRDEDLTTISTKDPAAMKELLSELRNATEIQVGDDKVAIPLDGMVAALLHMDDRQGRVGGVTALVKTGVIPASNIPAVPSLPVVNRHKIDVSLSDGEGERLIAQAKGSNKALFESEECQADASGGDLDVEAYPLSADRALVFIPCVMGAYQGSSLAFILPRKGDDAPLPFQPKLPLGDDETETRLLTEPEFDTNTGTLGMSGRGRLVGDCGLTAEWVWDGTEFQLSGVSYQRACGGSQLGDWPTLFRTR
ncbi:DUF1176 domain-containing protein [Rhizobium sp. CNPSo 3464]|uniref:DUF1176 domain-containing protein n=1 Tax=Rhizobium sp. CNPSo 3464 TaxID=3021406 RepID=UPI00254D58FE|nr:DUF1176 domain-containing protein [Rhizobium sp. CNPSo 3464]MDK4743661.1 DUF1176 domain-containing protein [Rhizobium sp. CNPSo 3464]